MLWGLSVFELLSRALVFRIGLIKLNEPTRRGIASQLRYFLRARPLLRPPHVPVHAPTHALFALVFLVYLPVEENYSRPPARICTRSNKF